MTHNFYIPAFFIMRSSLKKQVLYVTSFDGWGKTVSRLLQKSNILKCMENTLNILIKPNLVSKDKPPITTPVELIREIIRFLKSSKRDFRIAVAEGCGSIDYETETPFRELGYLELASEYGIKLIDLNKAPLVKLSSPDCKRWPEIYIPEIIMNSFLISVPVLKAHSMSDVTLTMKNMLGAAPPKHYNAGSWNKSAFHEKLHEAIFDLNRYRSPDFTVLDATVGMKTAHLWGPECNPKLNTLACCADPVAIDAFGAGLLGKNWKNIGHIKLADRVIGFAETKKIINL